MTSGDTQAWRALYGKLCAIYDRVFDEAQSRFYFDALKDCEVRDLEVAAVTLAQELKWFPKPAEWRAVMFRRRLEQQRARELALAGQRLTPELYCAECRDTGWTGEDVMAICACRATNPNYQKLSVQGREGEHLPAEAAAVLDHVRDFKRLQSGE